MKSGRVTKADALSAATFMMPDEDTETALQRIGGVEAWILEQTGKLIQLKG